MQITGSEEAADKCICVKASLYSATIKHILFARPSTALITMVPVASEAQALCDPLPLNISCVRQVWQLGLAPQYRPLPLHPPALLLGLFWEKTRMCVSNWRSQRDEGGLAGSNWHPRVFC